MALVGAGTVSADDMNIVRNWGKLVVAADGGALTCLSHGLLPDAVIGDMDSLGADGMERIPAGRIHEIAEQETTDFDKCLRSVAAPLAIAVGFAGPRLDHTLAVFNTLVRHGDRAVVVVAESDVAFHLFRAVDLDLAPGTRLSLFPMAEVGVRATGLAWPTDGIAFAPGGRIGTSNRATGPVRLVPDGPGMLVITPRAALEHVAAALLG